MRGVGRRDPWKDTGNKRHWRRRKKLLLKRVNTTTVTVDNGTANAGACVLCLCSDVDSDIVGEKRSSNGITIHYFCALFACGLSQSRDGRAEDDDEDLDDGPDRLWGFKVDDIRKEMKRSTKLKCTYCKRRRASIGCVVRNCSVRLHLPCGRNHGVLNQYFGTFSSYCKKHRPTQSIPIPEPHSTPALPPPPSTPTHIRARPSHSPRSCRVLCTPAKVSKRGVTLVTSPRHFSCGVPQTARRGTARRGKPFTVKSDDMQLGDLRGSVVSRKNGVQELGGSRWRGGVNGRTGRGRGAYNRTSPRRCSPRGARGGRGLDTTCPTCMCDIEATDDALLLPCCQRAVLHRQCLQRQATTSGIHFFRCPLCNDKDTFTAEMLIFGIYVPDRDAAWELDENAFRDQLQRHSRCDVIGCLCPSGRDYNLLDSEWEVMLCDWCGSEGTHLRCSDLLTPGDDWVCHTCLSATATTTINNLTNATPATHIANVTVIDTAIVTTNASTSTHSANATVAASPCRHRATAAMANRPRTHTDNDSIVATHAVNVTTALRNPTLSTGRQTAMVASSACATPTLNAAAASALTIAAAVHTTVATDVAAVGSRLSMNARRGRKRKNAGSLVPSYDSEENKNDEQGGSVKEQGGSVEGHGCSAAYKVRSVSASNLPNKKQPETVQKMSPMKTLNRIEASDNNFLDAVKQNKDESGLVRKSKEERSNAVPQTKKRSTTVPQTNLETLANTTGKESQECGAQESSAAGDTSMLSVGERNSCHRGLKGGRGGLKESLGSKQMDIRSWFTKILPATRVGVETCTTCSTTSLGTGESLVGNIIEVEILGGDMVRSDQKMAGLEGSRSEGGKRKRGGEKSFMRHGVTTIVCGGNNQMCGMGENKKLRGEGVGVTEGVCEAVGEGKTGSCSRDPIFSGQGKVKVSGVKETGYESEGEGARKSEVCGMAGVREMVVVSQVRPQRRRISCYVNTPERLDGIREILTRRCKPNQACLPPSYPACVSSLPTTSPARVIVSVGASSPVPMSSLCSDSPVRLSSLRSDSPVRMPSQGTSSPAQVMSRASRDSMYDVSMASREPLKVTSPNAGRSSPVRPLRSNHVTNITSERHSLVRGHVISNQSSDLSISDH